MRRLSLAVVATLLAGCSLLVDLSGLGGPSDASADASSTDASSTDAGNLLGNADFEHSTGGCGPGWATNNATMNAVDAAHSGAWACEVCVATPGKPAYFTASPTLKNPSVGATYFVQAYLQIEPDASLTEAALNVVENTAIGGVAMANVNANLASPSWQQLDTDTAAVKVDGSTVQYNILLTSSDAGGGCVRVDDTQMLAQ